MSDLDTIKGKKKMKKLVLPVLLSILLLCGCTSNSKPPELSAGNGSFNLTPQEYIDKINEVVQLQEDSRYLEIPDFEASGDNIEIIFLDLNLELTTDENGYLTKIFYTWDSGRKNIGYSLGLYFGLTFEMIAPDEEDLIFDKLDMMDAASEHYETGCTYNGIHFSYSMMGSGQFNYLTIEPASNSVE